MRAIFLLAGFLFLLSWGAQAVEKASPQAATAPVQEEWGGLTTYLVDLITMGQRTADWQERKRILVEYGALVRDGNELSLRDFRGGTDPASRAVGEGKAALVFHMLRDIAGEDRFLAAQKEFVGLAKGRQVSWSDVKEVFEKHTGRDLGRFFTEWVDGKGLPDLGIDNAVVRRGGKAFEVSFDIVQQGTAYELELSAAVKSRVGETKRETVKVDSNRKSVAIVADFEPATVVIDGDYDTARRLGPAETPPVIAAFLGSGKVIVVPPSLDRDRFAAVIEGFKKRGVVEKDPKDLTDADIKSASLVLLGENNAVAGSLYGKVETPPGAAGLVVKTNPWSAGRVVGIMAARSAEDAGALFRGISGLGDYSSVVVDRGRIFNKRTADSQRGMQMELRQETAAVDLSKLKTLTDVIEGAADKKIVYVGEYHDRFSHHSIELEVIKGLYAKDPQLAVGMEMFQRPYQPALDAYIAGTIDEREFLKRSEYFKRWGFDFNLYKPILDFCRDRKVPVVALNQRREITDKVSRGGFDSLTDEERKDVPAQMDFSDDEYRGRLKEVFGQHKNSSEREFDFFYQAQVLWDETMAQSVDEYLKKQPDRRMVVVAGGGHLAYRSGIPKRVFRRNGREYVVIMNDAEIERGVADYAVFPPSLEGVTAPRLMVVLMEDKEKVTIAGFSKESIAEKAGLRTGDVILSLDGDPVRDTGDVKLALFFKKNGDSVTIRVSRKRFLLGTKEMDFAVKL